MCVKQWLKDCLTKGPNFICNFSKGRRGVLAMDTVRSHSPVQSLESFHIAFSSPTLLTFRIKYFIGGQNLNGQSTHGKILSFDNSSCYEN